jgi:hypothetical protein
VRTKSVLAIVRNRSVAVALWATSALPTLKRLQDRFGVRGHVRALKAATCRRSPKFVATFPDSVFHHPHETFFDLTRFRRVTRYDGAANDEF